MPVPARAPNTPGERRRLVAPDGGSCLSFCLWNSREEARAAARRPAHVRAVGLLDEMYAQYRLEFHAVRRTADAPTSAAGTEARIAFGRAAAAAGLSARDVDYLITLAQ